MKTPKNLHNFILAMLVELEANEKKGDFDIWQPTPLELKQELDYHLEKLIIALRTRHKAGVTEYAADLANFCLKAYTNFGLPIQELEAERDLELLLKGDGSKPNIQGLLNPPQEFKDKVIGNLISQGIKDGTLAVQCSHCKQYSTQDVNGHLPSCPNYNDGKNATTGEKSPPPELDGGKIIDKIYDALTNMGDNPPDGYLIETCPKCKVQKTYERGEYKQGVFKHANFCPYNTVQEQLDKAK